MKWPTFFRVDFPERFLTGGVRLAFSWAVSGDQPAKHKMTRRQEFYGEYEADMILIGTCFANPDTRHVYIYTYIICHTVYIYTYDCTKCKWAKWHFGLFLCWISIIPHQHPKFVTLFHAVYCVNKIRWWKWGPMLLTSQLDGKNRTVDANISSGKLT